MTSPLYDPSDRTLPQGLPSTGNHFRHHQGTVNQWHLLGARQENTLYLQSQLLRCSLLDCEWAACHFYDVLFDGGEIVDSAFVGCHFGRVHFKSGVFRNLRFLNCSFTDCRFESPPDYFGIHFENCVFSSGGWSALYSHPEINLVDCAFLLAAGETAPSPSRGHSFVAPSETTKKKPLPAAKSAGPLPTDTAPSAPPSPTAATNLRPPNRFDKLEM